LFTSAVVEEVTGMSVSMCGGSSSSYAIIFWGRGKPSPQIPLPNIAFVKSIWIVRQTK